MLNKIKNNIIDKYIILNIIFHCILSYMRIIKVIEYQTFGSIIEILAIINVVISIILIMIKKIKYKNFKITIIDLLLLIMLLLGIISTIFAKYVPSAIHGATFRYEGIFAIAYYLSLAFLASYTKNKKTIINTILCDGIIQTTCSIFQVFKLFKGTPYKYQRTPYASGFVYNQNFYGSFVLMCLLFSIGLFYDEKSKIGKILYGFIISLFAMGLVLSNTTSCIIGLIIGLLYILIYSIKKKEYKKLICIISIILLTSSIAVNFGEITIITDLNQTKNEAIEMSKGNFDNNYGSARLLIWKETLKYVPENIIHGVGVDNFKKINNGKGIYIEGELCGKAHNEYLQILITEGIFCLLAYLLFYSKTVLSGIKESFKNNNFYLVVPIIGYLVQAFFNISVIDVAPIFWISIGFLIPRRNNNN